MKKRPFITSMVLTSLLLLTGCTDEPKPEDRFADYTKLWNKQNFEGMYDYLSADAKKEMSEEQFSERYEKIYKGIEMEDLKVEYKLPEELPKHKDEEKVEVTYSVSMETVAGPVEFKNEAILVKEGKDEKENWYIQWGPNYIFPELEEGEKVSVETYPAVRGEIVDRYEHGLAINGTVAQVGIVPEKMGEESAAISQVAKLLNMSVEEIEAELNQSWVQPSYFVPIKKLPQNDAKIAKLISIPGVSVTEVTERVYPYGAATAHLIGYVGEASAEDLEKLKGKGYTANDVIGKRGLEQLLEERLRGEAGAKIYIKADNGTEKVIAERKGKEGEFIALTIDAELQQDIYKQYNNEAGTAAAINPKTGETLALVSSPSFDPNQYVLGMSSAQQKALEENKDKPLLNRFSSTYAPGSTIKALTASVALKNGVDPNKALSIQGLTWKKSNWKDHSITRVANPGIPIDMKNALIYSDNIYFARQALDLGKDKFTSGLKDFGFEDTLPLEYPIKASSIGDISSEGRLADSGYGQGQVQMSAIHLAATYTAFLNEGNVIAPTLIQKDKMEPTIWKKNVITAKQANQLTGMLKQVVTHPKGSAHSLNDLKLDIAGKTGTAEIKASKNSTGTENGWLVAMDTKSSSLLMAWMIEDVKGRGGSHFVVDRMEPVLKKYIQ
ncbi:penicillin-binding transpeptidase domain-containing protein [Peribacillus asahii]|uniref:penicillin-binding transpeptidase domain-containing protein n=1 Tax=Peribacillus asahii TaxID=228899 RepID=UPI00207AC74C|nr:penicillin-binding transpeptidase domain-containing protein [Peribacillus asahii]USK84961.1 penicillin-binding transpeptidase domain-containing protein [Peribacillus asahii]